MQTRVYLYPVEPEKYPDFTRRHSKAVTRAALDNTIQFTSLRGFPTTSTNMKEIGEAADMGARPMPDDGSTLKEIEETIDLYVNYFKLGKVLWPVYPTLFAGNFRRLVDICVEKGLYLYDFWGFVPGSKPSEGIWGEYSIPADTDEYMKEKLGDHFLGYDNGEQDGRFIHASSTTALPTLSGLPAQYKRFQHYFQKLNDSMNNHTVTLASLTFLHYFAKEGNTIMIGAETAQALPSNPMWFAFIRGASKQYGLLNYGNASVWNRWGYKDYGVMDDEPDTSQGYERGRTGGTSLSLLRRLIYNQYVYNCDILGFEGSWFTTSDAAPDDKNDDLTYIVGKKKYNLTPVGVIQRECGKFVQKHGNPGILYTPLAVLADFNCGFVPPRHLYTGDIWKVWGNLPYKRGDYQLDCLLSMLYPGYENAGFYRDERGFMTPTPYGEILDVLLSDVSGEVMNRYSMIVIVSGTKLDIELFCKIKKFIDAGGQVITFADVVENATEKAKNRVDFNSLFCINNEIFTVNKFGKGSVTLINDPMKMGGLEETGEDTNYRNSVNADIPHPYRFKPEVETRLGELFDSTRIISVSNRCLQYTLDIKNNCEYTLYVSNNTLNTEEFNIVCHNGSLISVEQLEVTDNVSNLSEFLPRICEKETKISTEIGQYTLAPYQFALFTVKTEETQLEPLEESNPIQRDDDLYLSLGYSMKPAKDFLLEHPTFIQKFGGLYIPADYFERLNDETAEAEGHFFKLQNVNIIIDFTHLINHYPDMTLIGNFPNRTKESIVKAGKILDRAKYYGCEGAIFSIQRNAENEYSAEQARAGMMESLKALTTLCREKGITPYIVNRDGVFGQNEQLSIFDGKELGELAFNSSFAMCANLCDELPEKTGLLLLSDMFTDSYGQKYPLTNPISRQNRGTELAKLYKAAKEKGIKTALIAEYEDWDSVLEDLQLLTEE